MWTIRTSVKHGNIYIDNNTEELLFNVSIIRSQRHVEPVVKPKPTIKEGSSNFDYMALNVFTAKRSDPCNRYFFVLTFIQLDNFSEQLHSPSRGIYHHTASTIHHEERPSRKNPKGSTRCNKKCVHLNRF